MPPPLTAGAGAKPRLRWPLRFGIVAMVAILAALALTGGPGPRSAPEPRLHLANSSTPGDATLYAAVAARVAAGSSYYPAVVQLHRERGYPLRPFVTVRPPTLALVSAALGPAGTLALALGLVAANAIAWYARLRDAGPLLRFGSLAGLSALGAAGISPEVLAMHEWWSGLLLSLALGIDRDRHFGAVLACATVAALVRELAVVFLIVLIAAELLRRSWRRAAVIGAILIALAALLVLHWMAVTALTRPDDVASPGWLGMRGIAGFVRDYAVLLNLEWLPAPLTWCVTLAPLAGWFAARRELGGFPLAWFSSFVLLEGFAARPDTFYWAQLIQPSFLLGWLFVIATILPGRGRGQY